MNYWWKENKTYAVAAGGGLLALLLWYVFLVGKWNADTDLIVRQLGQDKTSLDRRLASGAPAEDTLGRAERDRRDLQNEHLKVLLAGAEFEIDEAFRFREGVGRTIQEAFGRARGNLQKELDKGCRERGFQQIPPNFGMPSGLHGLQEREDVAREWMMRLAMVKRICLLAIEHAERMELVETVPNQLQEVSEIDPKRFLNRLRIRFKVWAPEEGIIRMVHGLQQKGTYLGLESFTTQIADPGRDLIQADFTVTGLAVFPDQELVSPEQRE